MDVTTDAVLHFYKITTLAYVKSFIKKTDPSIKSIKFIFSSTGDEFEQIQDYLIHELSKFPNLTTFIFTGSDAYDDKKIYVRDFINFMLMRFTDRQITVHLDKLPLNQLMFNDIIVIEKLVMPVYIKGEIITGIKTLAKIKEIITLPMSQGEECAFETRVYGKKHKFIAC